MRMISYAGNREDVLLRRLFPDDATGFYVDVGAGFPDDHSLSKHFSDRGWRGINIEPSPTLFERLEAERTRDVNLNIAISDSAGKLTLYECPLECWGFSTLSPDQAELHRKAGIELREVEVDVRTLADVFEEHVTGTIDFLSVDVEGLEAEVLRGADWDRWRPRVVIVEATRPNTPIPSHQAWEPILLDAGYSCAYFDGLNRFYLRPEDIDLAERLAVPVNVFDDYEPYEYVHQIELFRAASVDSQGRVLAEAVLREGAEAANRRLRALNEEQARIIDDLERRCAELRNAPSALPEGVGPLGLTVARVLGRWAHRFPAVARSARTLLGGAVKARRKLRSRHL